MQDFQSTDCEINQVVMMLSIVRFLSMKDNIDEWVSYWLNIKQGVICYIKVISINQGKDWNSFEKKNEPLKETDYHKLDFCTAQQYTRKFSSS